MSLTTLYVAQTGLTVANAGLSATSQNVANATTPGYSRRRVDQSVGAPVQRSQLWVGTGARADRIARASDNLLGMQRVREAGVASAAATTNKVLASVEARFEPETSPSIRERLDGFQGALLSATADPADASLRRQVAQAGSDLAIDLNSLSNSLEADQRQLEHAMRGTLVPFNAKLSEVAALNRKLEQAGGPLSAGDLADRRDSIIRDLAQSAGVTVNLDPAGGATVMLGGHALVSGGEARSVSLVTAVGADPKVVVSADGGQLDVTRDVAGTLGGNLDAYAQLGAYQDSLNGFAQEFADAVNAQHTQGFDRSGAAGADLFSYGSDPAASLSFNASVLDDPDRLAFAADPAGAAGDAGNLTKMIDLGRQALPSGATAGSMLSSLSSAIGNDVAASGALADRTDAVLGDLDQLAASLQGVDLDEEAANLITYQTAYQAAAKVIAASDQMLGTLMELV